MTLEDDERSSFRISLIKVAIAYEQRTTAIPATLKLIMRASLEGQSVPRVKEAINGFTSILEPHGLDFRRYFAGLLLFNVLAEVEIYFADVVRLIIKQHPKKVGDTTLRLAEVLDSNTDDLVAAAADQWLSRIMYKRPTEYLKEFCEFLSIKSDPLALEWPQYIEAKARRDLGAHNAWRANATYRRKVVEATLACSVADGELLCPQVEYLRAVCKVCDAIVRNVGDQLEAKYT